MKSKSMQVMRAKMPRDVQEKTTLERSVFDSTKMADLAARAFYRRFPSCKEPLWLVIHLASSFRKRAAYLSRRGRLVIGPAFYFSVEGQA